MNPITPTVAPHRWLTFLGLAVQILCVGAVTQFNFMDLHWLALLLSGFCALCFLVESIRIRWRLTRVFYFYYLVFEVPLLVLVAFYFFTSGSFNSSFWITTFLCIAGIHLSLLSEYGRCLLANQAFAEDLQELFPAKSTHFVDNDIESEIDTSSIQTGYHVRVSPDQTIPCDGIVTFGSSLVDESGISGLKEPKIKNLGSVVLAGSLNKSGSIVVRALVPPRQSLAWRLRDQLQRMPALRSVDLLYFVFLSGSPVLFLAVNLLLEQRSIAALFSAFMFHLACGFLLVKKIHILKSNLALAAGGVFFRSIRVLERIACVDLILTGARGVLTEDQLKLSRIQSFGGLSDEAVLRFLMPIARKLESSEAYALIKEGKLRSIPFEMIEAYSETSDGGIGMVAVDEVRWQTISHQDQLDAFPNEVSYALNTVLEEGGLGILLIVNGVLMGIVTMIDTMKQDVPESIAKLRAKGVELVLKGGRLKVQTSHTLPDSSQVQVFLHGTSEKKMSALVHHLGPGFESEHVLHSSIHGENANIDLILMNEDLNSFAYLIAQARSMLGFQNGVNWGILVLQGLVYLPAFFMAYQISAIFFLIVTAVIVIVAYENPKPRAN